VAGAPSQLDSCLTVSRLRRRKIATEITFAGMETPLGHPELLGRHDLLPRREVLVYGSKWIVYSGAPIPGGIFASSPIPGFHNPFGIQHFSLRVLPLPNTDST